MIQQTSIDAYISIKPELGKRQWQIFSLIHAYGPITNREIAKKLGLDMCSITGRTKELRQNGYVASSGKKICPTTKRTVLMWKVV